jgi:hypothetical protein
MVNSILFFKDHLNHHLKNQFLITSKIIKENII